MTPEGKIKNEVKKALNRAGAWFYMPVQNGMGVVGIPDFVGCYRGHFFAIETKAPGKAKNLTPNQMLRMDEIRAAGGAAFVVDGAESWAQVDEWMTTVERSRHAT